MPAAGDRDVPESIEPALQQTWDSYAEDTRQRLAVIESAIAALAAGTLNADLRARACAEVHNLMGASGTFGLHVACEIARAMRDHLDAAHNAADAARLATLTDRLRHELQIST